MTRTYEEEVKDRLQRINQLQQDINSCKEYVSPGEHVLADFLIETLKLVKELADKEPR